MRAVSLHADVLVVTSRLLATNCTIVRGPAGAAEEGEVVSSEVFVVDSPILPDELELLGALLEQAGFAAPSGLLATHADWDHLLAPLAFPGAPLGCAQSTAERLASQPGVAQRELRDFDRGLYIERPRPLSLGAPQALPVPGRCGLGAGELELHPAEGHTPDGMAIVVPWAGVLVAGDYLSAIEIPTLAGPGAPARYQDTLRLLSGLLDTVERVVPGHGPVLSSGDARRVLDEDLAYVGDLAARGAHAELPPGRRTGAQRALHAENVRRISSPGS